MRIDSMFFRDEINILSIHRNEEELMLLTDPSSSMPGSLYITPKDILHFARLSFKPSIIVYLVLLPLLYIRWRNQQRRKENSTDGAL